MNINLYTWFSERELDFCPKHFVMATTPITDESKLWILERLHGRFYIHAVWDDKSPSYSIKTYLTQPVEVPVFEDPEEATLYELTWS